MKFIQWPFRFVFGLVQPDFWRRLTTGQVLMAVYLKSGQTVYFKCTNWEATLGGDNPKWKAKGLNTTVFFDPDEIVAFKVVNWWR